jgi:hypothetical protein
MEEKPAMPSLAELLEGKTGPWPAQPGRKKIYIYLFIYIYTASKKL